MTDEPISFADRKRASETPDDPIVSRMLAELTRMIDSPGALRAAVAKLPTGRVLLLNVTASMEVIARFGADVNSTITVLDDRQAGGPSTVDDEGGP